MTEIFFHSKNNLARCDHECILVFVQITVSKITQISSDMKIRPMEAELFLADGQTDMTNLIVASPNFASVHKYHLL